MSLRVTIPHPSRNRERKGKTLSCESEQTPRARGHGPMGTARVCVKRWPERLTALRAPWGRETGRDCLWEVGICPVVLNPFEERPGEQKGRSTDKSSPEQLRAGSPPTLAEEKPHGGNSSCLPPRPCLSSTSESLTSVQLSRCLLTAAYLN